MRKSVMSTNVDTEQLWQKITSGGVERPVQSANRIGTVLKRIVAIEFLTIAFTAYLSCFLYYHTILRAEPAPTLYIFASLIIATLILLVSIAFGHYSRIHSQPRHSYLVSGIGAVGLAFSFFLSFLFLLKITDDYSRGVFFVQLFATGGVIAVVRAIAHIKLQSSIANNRIEARRVILIGRSSHCSHVMKTLKDSGIRIVAVFPFPSSRANSSEGVPLKDCTIRQIIRQCRPLCPDDILVFTTERDLPEVARLTDALSELPASLHMVPIGLEGILATSKLAELGPLPTIQLLQLPLSQFDKFIKRAFDLVAASIGLIMLAPLFVTVAAAIRLESRGPVFFRQTRHGFNNELIHIFKFRSMHTIEDGHNFTQAVKNDPRVTAVGHFLRKTNIDELPQLFNVLFGQMSLVGPRPHPIALNDLFEQQITPLSRRHNVKPGITGWAQVNGFRGETDTLEKMQRRLQHDFYYIDHWSFLFDMQIIMMTLISKKAYCNAY
jgi:Undecaprenyl-phosphate glucose phosphotransferase